MSQDTINQRLIFLLNALGMKAGSFSRALGVSETTVRNYLDRNSKPSSDILEKIAYTFEQVNLTWLVTGRGEPLLTDVPTQTNISGKKSAVNVLGNNHGTATQNNYTVADCEKERDAYKAERDQARQQVEHLQAQLATKDALIASKEETIKVYQFTFKLPE